MLSKVNGTDYFVTERFPLLMLRENHHTRVMLTLEVWPANLQ